MRVGFAFFAIAAVLSGCNESKLIAGAGCSSGVVSAGSAATAPDAVPADGQTLVTAMDVTVPVTNVVLKDAPDQAAAFSGLGTLHPTKGANFAFLATGIAGTGSAKALETWATSTENADAVPGGQPCDFDPFSFDCVMLSFTFVAPADAHSLAFDFSFMSAEYPEFVGSNFNDTFRVAESSATNNYDNIVYDSSGHPIDINNVFFVQPCSQLTGTGYDIYRQLDPTACDAGGTGMLTTMAPVTAGETVTMTFWIWDQADAWLDSAVMIDNFRFDPSPVTTPVTTTPTPTPVASATPGPTPCS